MKPRFKIDWKVLVGVAIAILLSVRLFSYYRQQHYRDAISSFYNQLNSTRKEYQPKFDADMAKTWPTSGLYQSYYLALNSLDASSCPSDFQRAWTDCLEKERACADAFEDYAGGVNFVTAIVEFKLKDVWDRALKTRNERDSAYIQLDAVAERYDVKFNQ